ncbi:MAG: UDP-N-acetylmuramate--L-alanine ligase [Thermotogae bacterium]|nr:UDP-N-acetylmuramate--L-alanine ligase [Thermotogota bacterium]
MLYHFVGIGGIGMSALALHLKLKNGDEVYGSNLEENDRTIYLREHGIEVFITHSEDNWKNPDCLIVSTAVNKTNPEVQKALREGVPILKRMELLIQELKKYYSIGISGTDGKSTTTAMIFHLLSKLEEAPTSLLGAIHPDLNHGNYHLGNNRMVVEIDESDGYVKNATVNVAVLTNVRPDHLEHYGGRFENLREAMKLFLSNAEDAICIFRDEEETWELASSISRISLLSFGCNRASTLRLVERKIISKKPYVQEFVVEHGNGRVKGCLRIPGVHNVFNALASCCALVAMGYPPDVISMLEDFLPVKRRFNVLFEDEKRRLIVIEDYAHTPREIAETLQAVKEVYDDKKLISVFQPHRYTRLARENGNFARVLEKSDEVHVLPLFDAYEKEIKGVNEKEIVDHLRGKNVPSHFHEDMWNVVDDLKHVSNSVVLFIGAGDITDVAKEYVRLCRSTT